MVDTATKKERRRAAAIVRAYAYELGQKLAANPNASNAAMVRQVMAKVHDLADQIRSGAPAPKRAVELEKNAIGLDNEYSLEDINKAQDILREANPFLGE